MCNVHGTFDDKVSKQQQKEQHITAGQKIVTDPFIHLNISDENEGKKIFQQQMSTAPTDVVQTEKSTKNTKW